MIITTILYGHTDVPGLLSFWTVVIAIIFIVRILKGIDERQIRKLDQKFSDNLFVQNNMRRQIGLKLPSTSPKTFPVLQFVQQRHFNQAEYCDENLESQIGKSEKILYGKLVEYFDSNKIYWNSRQIGKKRPDFIYEDKIKNVYIAIEIDEPYIYKTRTPIHYYGNEVDAKKESIYKTSGWTLIRFSESQVINYPNECCKFLAQVIDYYQIELKYSKIPRPDTLGILPPDKHWDYNEAMIMAQIGTRH